MLSRALLDLAFQVRALLAEVQVEELWEFPPVPSLSAFPRLDVVPELVRVFQNPFPRQNSISSLELTTVLRRLHCSPGSFLRNDL